MRNFSNVDRNSDTSKGKKENRKKGEKKKELDNKVLIRIHHTRKIRVWNF